MKYSLALLAAATAVSASPFMRRQAVTAKISPTAAAPSGCMPTYTGTFGIAVMNVTASASKAGVTTMSDGQPGASTKGTAVVSTISDGQPQAPTSSKAVAPVTTISDGQPQAATSKAVAPVSTISDGQPQAATGTKSAVPVSQISDGQIQATTMTMKPINQITDGQIQNKMSTSVKPVSQISDGQIQASPKASATAVSQISDGQIQATTAGKTATPVATISDGQPQASTAKATASAVATISDGQPQASTKSAVATLSDGQPQASTKSASAGASTASGMSYVACKADDTLEITLAGGVLTDNKGRTGYIASNYQFQFDGPPQAGAIYTAGWTVCGNSSLALGGSAVFYQCLSGDFYNLYDRNWAPQCVPITIQTVNLVDC